MAFRHSSPQSLSFPGEEDRESWINNPDGVWQRVELVSPSVMGVAAMAFDSAPFWSLSTAEEHADAVALRWEGLGVSNERDSHLWTFWPVMRREQQVLVGTLALTAAADLPDSPRYEPSARMLPLPSNGIAVWRELGRYVVAFTRDSALLHVAVLTARRLDVDAAFEMRDLSAALQAHDFFDEVPVIHVWAQCDTDFAPQLACLFEVAGILREPRPDPGLPAAASGLLPIQVAAMRQQQKRQRRQILLLAAAALVYLCFFGAWWLRLEWRESALNQIDIEMNARQPEIELVRKAQQHWLEMEAAINPDLYPVELFHQIVSLLPDEGIRLKEFQMEDGRLVVSGEAATVNQALGFKDRLAACEPLQRYAWNFPVPTIRDDNRADFRAEGTLNGEVMHAGQ